MTEWCNLYPKLYTTNSASANVVSFQHQNLIAMSFYFEHTQNWQDATGRWLRHNNFMLELKEECERLDISYTLPVQPISESRPNDAPPEAYNMGEKASYGLEGLVRRRPFQDNTKESYQPNSSAMSVSHSAPNVANSDNSGAQAGAAATMMFAESM
jgi:hypothetical protein